MACYRLLIKSSAARELEAIPASYRKRIVARISGLAADPRPAGSEKLSGEEKYRLRQGDYRVLCAIEDRARTVMVVRIAYRREAYRK